MARDLDELGELIKSLLQLIYLIIISYVGYQVLRAVLGGTWATENIIIAGMGIILAGLFVIVGFLIHQAVTIGKLDERTQTFEKRIDKLEKRRK